MANNKVQKRKYVIGLLVLLAMATVSTYAWSIDETLTTDPSQVYVTTNSGTEVNISNYESKPLGKNKIQITFTTDVDCDMNFTFIDDDGEIIDVNRDVEIAIDSGVSTDCTENSDNTWSAPAQVTAGDHIIVIQRAAAQTDTQLWKDLYYSGAGDVSYQTFDGLMIVIK